jgi:hypothetical protein
MRKLIIIISSLFLFTACYDKNDKGELIPIKNFYTKTIDSCEYLFTDGSGTLGQGAAIVHKGNCKFCITRNKNK